MKNQDKENVAPKTKTRAANGTAPMVKQMEKLKNTVGNTPAKHY